MIQQTVLLVGERAPELRDALHDCGYRLICSPCWEAFGAQKETAQVGLVVADASPPPGHFAAEWPHVVMRPAFAWEGDEFVQDPPGWEFTRLALLNRMERQMSGRPPMKMMIVDDESGIRTAMQAMLSRFGLEVVAESDRARSLETLSDGSVDLLLTDVNMPGICWQDYIVEVKRVSFRTVIYLATGDRDVAPVDGVEGILHKPFGLSEVAELAAPLLKPQAANSPQKITHAPIEIY